MIRRVSLGSLVLGCVVRVWLVPGWLAPGWLLPGSLVLGACGGDPASPADAGEPAPNLTIDGPRAQHSARVVWEYFEESDCAIVEGCVEGAGWRRLLRFETFTPNVGNADFHMGAPADHPDLFSYSSCHRHYHYDGYAEYRLFDSGGTLSANGHKQAFCLMDSEPVSDAPGVPRDPQYDCGDQGISRGWGDSYYASLDCQWIDVTEVDPGEYVLRISINDGRTISESSYDDNVATVPVTIPDDSAIDATLPCERTIDGPRDCGWTVAGSFDCEAGRVYEVGCGSGCGLGTCGPGDDPVMRVCEGDAPCASRAQLAYGDDGCGAGYCSLATFTCPAGGRFTVMTAPYLVGAAYTCAPAARLAP